MIALLLTMHFVFGLHPATYSVQVNGMNIITEEAGPYHVLAFEAPISIAGSEVVITPVGGISSVDLPPPTPPILQPVPPVKAVPWWREVLDWIVGLFR